MPDGLPAILLLLAACFSWLTPYPFWVDGLIVAAIFTWDATR